MFSKKLAALVATSLVVATSPAIAQSNGASKLSLTRAGAPVAEASAMGNQDDGRFAGGFWVAILGAALLAALILVGIAEEDEDLPDSP